MRFLKSDFPRNKLPRQPLLTRPDTHTHNNITHLFLQYSTVLHCTPPHSVAPQYHTLHNDNDMIEVAPDNGR
jgi:hypothetical protein